MKPTSKVIQICSYPFDKKEETPNGGFVIYRHTAILALCENGSIWELGDGAEEAGWKCILESNNSLGDAEYGELKKVMREFNAQMSKIS